MGNNSEMLENDDHQAATRKQDHIELAFRLPLLRHSMTVDLIMNRCFPNIKVS